MFAYFLSSSLVLSKLYSYNKKTNAFFHACAHNYLITLKNGGLHMIKIKIVHWSYGGSVEKIVTFEKIGDVWESSDGDVTLELIENN
jgi:hypothetical protein